MVADVDNVATINGNKRLSKYIAIAATMDGHTDNLKQQAKRIKKDLNEQNTPT